MRRAWRHWVASVLATALLGCGQRSASTEPASPPAPADGPLYPIRVAGKWGYMDRAGRTAIAPQWDDAGDFAEGLAVVGNRSTDTDGGVTTVRAHQGWIDRNGTVVIPLVWDDAQPFAGGLARVVRDGRHGFVDRDGREAIAPAYEDAADFGDGLAPVRRNGKTGFIDRSGQVVIPFRYERAAWISRFVDGRACAFVRDDRSGDEYAGYLDPQGHMAIPARYAFAQPFSEGLALARRELSDPMEFIDRDGRTVIATGGDDALSFTEGLAAVHVAAGWTYVDRTGATVIGPLPYRHVGAFVDGRAGVAAGMRWGFIDRTGREVVPPTWAGINRFHDGLARMESGSLFGGLRIEYLDRDGGIVWRER